MKVCIQKQEHQILDQTDKSQEPIPSIQLKNSIRFAQGDYDLVELGKKKTFAADQLEPASYENALEFKGRFSYQILNENETYVNFYLQQQFPFCVDNQQLACFGIGVSLYMSFLKKQCIFYFIMSLIAIVSLVFNFIEGGYGTDNYLKSYSYFLSASTIGNSNQPNTTLILCQTISDLLYTIVFFAFIIYWRRFSYNFMIQFQQNKNFIQPRKYSVSINGFGEQTTEQQLKEHFMIFGQIYQVSIIYDYKDNLIDLYEYLKLQQKIKFLKLHLRLTNIPQQRNKIQQNLQSLNLDKNNIYSKLEVFNITPLPIYAIIHFEKPQSRNNLLQVFNSHYRFHTYTHAFYRFFCCYQQQIVPQCNLKDKKLFVKQQLLTNPQLIKWQNTQVGTLSKIARILLVVLVILIILIISSLIIGIAYIFGGTGTSCSSQVTLTQAQSGNATLLQCYCRSNAYSLLTDETLSTLCSSYINSIITSQAIYTAVAISSTIINFIFVILVRYLIEFTRPQNQSSTLIANTYVLIFSIYTNSAILPILVNADIYGFKPVNNIIFILKLLGIDTSKITFYTDFNSDWYFYFTTYCVNFIIILIFAPLGRVVFAKLKNFYFSYNLKQQQQKILQVQMNRRILTYQYQFSEQFAKMVVIVLMTLTFCSGIPILLLLGTMALLSHYLCSKYLFLYQSRRVHGLNEVVVNMWNKFLCLGVVMHLGFGIWMYTGVFNKQSLDIVSLKIESQKQIIRIFWISYLVVFQFIAVVFMFFDLTFVNIISFLTGLCFSLKQHKSKLIQNYSQYVPRMSQLHSYKISNHPKYKSIASALAYTQLN